MDIKEQILTALGIEKKINLEWQAKSEDGTIFVSTAEELEAGVDISVLTEDGTTILLPVGTYKTDTGVSFRVEEEGIVAEVIESETEEEVVEEEVENKDEKKEYADVEDWEGMEKRIQNLEDAVASLKVEDLEDEEEEEEKEEELSAPNKTPRKTKTTIVDEFAEMKAENKRLKIELAKTPADRPLNTNKFSKEIVKPTKQQLSKMSKQEKYLYNLYN